MPTTEFNAVVDLDVHDPTGGVADDILDALATHHSALTTSARGTLETVIAVPAHLAEAAAWRLGACQSATGATPVALAATATEGFDHRR